METLINKNIYKLMIHNKMMNKFDEYDLKLIKSLHLLIKTSKKLP